MATAITLDKLKKSLISQGYSVRDGKTKTTLIVETAKGENRQATLKSIASSFNGKFESSSSMSKQGAVKIGSFTVYTKPAIGNVSTLDARIFTTGGDDYDMPYYESSIKTKRFSSVSQLEKSIINGCISSPLLGESIADIVQAMFDGRKVDWGNTPTAVINKLAVYLGEVLVGWAFLSGKNNLITGYNTGSKKAKYFIIPTDPSFSGVDSFVQFNNEEKLAISSKAGAGAKASIFTNLVPNAIKMLSDQPNTSFTKFCKYLNDKNIKATDSKTAVWTYAIRVLLNIPANKVADPVKLQSDIRLKQASIELPLVLKELEKKYELAANEKAALPDSLSVIFSKRIAEEFNEDSLQQINNILQGKDYYQANLSTTDWAKGAIKFTFTKAGSGKVKIFGDKSAVTDITAKQGWINYEIKAQ